MIANFLNFVKPFLSPTEKTALGESGFAYIYYLLSIKISLSFSSNSSLARDLEFVKKEVSKK